MDVPSDDLFAEMFTKQLGVLFGRGGTITAGRARDLGTRSPPPTACTPRSSTAPGSPATTAPRRWRSSTCCATCGAPGRRRAGGVAADRRRQRHRPGDRAQDRRRRPLHRQDGTLDDVTNLAGYCRSRAATRWRSRSSSTGPSNGTAFCAGEPDGRRDRPLLTVGLAGAIDDVTRSLAGSVADSTGSRTPVELAHALNRARAAALPEPGRRSLADAGGAARRRPGRRRARRAAPARARARVRRRARLLRRSTGCRGWSASTRRRSLWDALEMGDPADVHCYTPAEFQRKRATLPRGRGRGRARAAAVRGLRPAVPAAADVPRGQRRRRAQLIATIRSIGTRARSAISAGDLDLVDAVAQRVAELGQRDHLHEPAVRGLVGGDELDVGRRLAQRMQHPGLGGDDRRPRCRRRSCSSSRA